MYESQKRLLSLRIENVLTNRVYGRGLCETAPWDTGYFRKVYRSI